MDRRSHLTELCSVSARCADRCSPPTGRLSCGQASKFAPANLSNPRGFGPTRSTKMIKTRFAGLGHFGGEGGIRTPGPLARSTDFESAPFDHSGTSPLWPRIITAISPVCPGRMRRIQKLLANLRRRTWSIIVNPGKSGCPHIRIIE